MRLKGLRIAAIAFAGVMALAGCRDRDKDLDKGYGGSGRAGSPASDIRQTPSDQSGTVTPPASPSTPATPTEPATPGTGGSGTVDQPGDMSQPKPGTESESKDLDKSDLDKDYRLPLQRQP